MPSFPFRARRHLAVLTVVLALVFVIALWTVPRWLVPALSERFPGCTYAVETSAPAVALTIDDGPDSSTTPIVLRALRNHDARATFFLISGNVANGDSSVSAMIMEGHEIANHLTRDEASISLSSQAFDSALVAAGRTLSRYGPVRWARPMMPRSLHPASARRLCWRTFDPVQSLSCMTAGLAGAARLRPSIASYPSFAVAAFVL